MKMYLELVETHLIFKEKAGFYRDLSSFWRANLHSFDLLPFVIAKAADF
jgi:hypothetical protein